MGSEASPATLFLEDEFATLAPRGIGDLLFVVYSEDLSLLTGIGEFQAADACHRPDGAGLRILHICGESCATSARGKCIHIEAFCMEDAGHEVSVVDLSHERWLRPEIGCYSPCMPVSPNMEAKPVSHWDMFVALMLVVLCGFERFGSLPVSVGPTEQWEAGNAWGMPRAGAHQVSEVAR